MKKIRVGVAGYGTIGQRLADGVAMQEDMELVDQMLEQTLIVCDTECSDAFQYGFSAGLLLMQEVQEILCKRVDTAAQGIF